MFSRITRECVSFLFLAVVCFGCAKDRTSGDRTADISSPPIAENRSESRDGLSGNVLNPKLVRERNALTRRTV